jgi:hypothetical protein
MRDRRFVQTSVTCTSSHRSQRRCQQGAMRARRPNSSRARDLPVRDDTDSGVAGERRSGAEERERHSDALKRSDRLLVEARSMEATTRGGMPPARSLSSPGQ